MRAKEAGDISLSLFAGRTADISGRFKAKEAIFAIQQAAAATFKCARTAMLYNAKFTDERCASIIYAYAY